MNVLLIDAQSDFVDEPVEGGLMDGILGRLPVVGAKDDMPRIARFLQTNAAKINKVYASMDTHTVCHIGHRFWKGVDGTIAPGGTVFEVKDEKIMSVYPPIQEYHVNVTPEHIPVMDKYAKLYIQGVQTKGKEGRNGVNTWNVHCIENQPGWNIQPTVKTQLDSMNGKVEYYVKGQNQLAEMYSIFAAEMPYEDIVSQMTSEEQEVVKQYVYNPDLLDATKLTDVIPARAMNGEMDNATDHTTYPVAGDKYRNLNTTFNMELFEKLTANNATIVVCGEALSHCVQFSARDLIGKIKETGKTNKVILLGNGSSPVVMPPGQEFLTNLFKTSSDKFISDMQKKNVADGINTSVLSIDDNGSLSAYGIGKLFNNTGLTNSRSRFQKGLNSLKGIILGYVRPKQSGGRRKKTRRHRTRRVKKTRGRSRRY